MRLFFGILLCLLLLNGCASLSEEECAVGAWKQIGKNDAMQGFKSTRFAVHQKACTLHQIDSDPKSYQEGYQLGLVSYCSASNGFDVGRNGYQYHDICPRPSEQKFLSGYKYGQSLHKIETLIAEKNLALRKVKDQLSKPKSTLPDANETKSVRHLRRLQMKYNQELHILEDRRGRALLNADQFLQDIEINL